LASTIIHTIRKAKTTHNRSMRAPIATLSISAPEPQLIESIGADLRAAGNVTTLNLTRSPDEDIHIDVVLASVEGAG
jgi:hypothetical protein